MPCEMLEGLVMARTGMGWGTGLGYRVSEGLENSVIKLNHVLVQKFKKLQFIQKIHDEQNTEIVQ